jgi:hypothetical protein
VHPVLFGHLAIKYSLFILCLAVLCTAAVAHAQDPLPKIGPFVVDLHATVPKYPSSPLLAASHDVVVAELPGRGLGVQVGGQVYFFRWRAVTFGIGGEYAASRGRKSPPDRQGSSTATDTTALRETEEKFSSAGSALSFNFGTGHGWSYISGGIGQSTWSLIPVGRAAFASDVARLKTINYGGGARWFAKAHVAFSFDVRFYAINPGPAFLDFPGSPRTTLLVIGAGVSVK